MATGWLREAGRRGATLFCPKLGLAVAMTSVFWLGYGWLSRHAILPLREVPVTWLDRTVPFAPVPWAAIYLSQFLLTGGMPWLITTREQLRRYAVAVGLLSGAAFVVFLLCPVASPRPPGLAWDGAMAWIVRLDGPYNAFPSLHAGYLVLIGGLGRQLWPGRIPPPVVAGFGGWAAAILYSTLATGQHYAWDLAAGAALGWVAHRVAWREATGSAPARSGKSAGVSG